MTQCHHGGELGRCGACDAVVALRKVMVRSSSSGLAVEEIVDTQTLDPRCRFRLDQMDNVECACSRPGNVKMIPAYGCVRHGRCSVSVLLPKERGVMPCRLCGERQEPGDNLDPVKAPRWSYAVTAVNASRLTTLPQTLLSLEKAGFDDPILCVDGCEPSEWSDCRLRFTARRPNVGAYGNWWLSAQECYVRDPQADFYAVFQDDVTFCRDLRKYLELVPWPGPGYLNLYTVPDNERSGQQAGKFHPARGRGLGAIALIFRREEFHRLLTHQHMVDKFVPKPDHPHRSYKAVDGGIWTAFQKMGMREWVHHPSLVQHTGGESSTLGNYNPQSKTFPKDPNFSCLELLK